MILNIDKFTEHKFTEHKFTEHLYAFVSNDKLNRTEWHYPFQRYSLHYKNMKKSRNIGKHNEYVNSVPRGRLVEEPGLQNLFNLLSIKLQTTTSRKKFCLRKKERSCSEH